MSSLISPNTKTTRELSKPPDDEALINECLISSISNTLNIVIKKNSSIELTPKKWIKRKAQYFYAKTIPEISIKDYWIRIQTYAKIEDSTLILSLIYIDRLCESCDISWSNYNIHRILFSSILCALKYNEDYYYSNTYYADIAGISSQELKQIENAFIDLIQFSFYVDHPLFNQYHNYLKPLSNKE